MLDDVVIVVDEWDRELGVVPKLQAHREGVLHRAFSILVFGNGGQVLVQKRAASKYHSGGLWSNTCCSHPRPTEHIEVTAHHRLRQEMGIDCNLRLVFKFLYKARVSDELWEHEIDYVFVGRHDDNPSPNPTEVQNWRWAGVEELLADQLNNPDAYSVWFKILLKELLAHGLVPKGPGETSA